MEGADLTRAKLLKTNLRGVDFSIKPDLLGHTAPINALAYCPDGSRIVTGSKDKTVQIWDSNSGESLKILKDIDSMVNCVAFSPDGYKIAAGTLDHKTKVWDSKTGACL